ncbi:MAG: phage baseplate assembly protein V [Candidatus Accumulibacter sp.]|uniref:phage baseplate assembly protein V n=1 Tax=Accumulibacter sp. TaxID=2053492 RepID=UPI0025F0E4B6|nr:phage baseplate assembly protein V [Accumulibacter sp.]MCM8599001.1 phage baseplate assembly protein V [Accumulibacter sp.]MCM8663160.1 phage baseplate assembly protein V [Accumulibacter sp.]
MNLGDVLLEHGATTAINGVVVAVVTNNQDPDGLGRVKLKFPWLSDADESFWARVATPMAGGGRGAFFLPEVDDEVLVAFEHGDLRFPYVLGGLWNAKDKPPADNGDGKNNVRLIRSRSGHVVRLSDEDGKEKIEIIDKSEKNSIVFDTANNTITITADKDIALSAPQGTIKLDAQKVELKSSADAKVEAGAGMDVKASATLNLKGATVNIN